jgi:hypothetical protein
MTERQTAKLWAWRDSWNVGKMNCYENIGVQIFVEMADDPEFRKAVIKRLRVPRKIRKLLAARP